MGYDPIGEIYSGSPNASIDPLAMQQAVDEDEQLKRQREAAAQQEQAIQQEQAQAAQVQEQQAAQEAKPLAEVGAAVGGGLIDFVDDTVEAAGKITGQPWEGFADDFGPQNKTQWGKALRAVVSFIGPTVGIGSVAKSVLTKIALRAGATGITTGAAAFAGKAALDAGVGVGVDVINRNSTDDNLMRVLKEHAPGVVGWAPDDWATLDSDSPDIKRKKNVLEGLGLGLLASGIEGMIGFSRMLKGKKPGVEFIPKDDVARKGFQEITNKSPMPKAQDPIVDRIVKDEIYRGKTVDEDALRAVNEAGGIENVNDFHPSIHSEAADDYETLGQAVRPDGLAQAVVDTARISSNVGTTHGRISNFMTSPAIKALNLDGVHGRELVKKIEDNLKRLGNFEARLPDGRMMTMEDIESSGTALYAQLVDPRMTSGDIHQLFRTFGAIENRDIAEGLKGVEVISERGYAAAMNAIKQLKEDFLNPTTARASAYLQTNLAGQISDHASVVRLSDGSIDPTYIQERVLDNLEALWYEVDLNTSVSGWALNNKKLWQDMQGDKLARAKTFGAQYTELKTQARVRAERAKAFFTDLKAMNKSNPEFVAPLMHAYDLTDGNVNSIKKLTDYMNQSLGVLNKAFIDGQPQIPSQVVQGLWATLYNAKLSSLLTPVKALSNNFALLLMKPANVMLGAIKSGDGRTIHRAWVQYATHMDTTMKASADYMGQMFRRVAAEPSLTQRADFIAQNKDAIQLAREYAAAQAANGNYSAQHMVNFVDMMEKVNNHPWIRYSMNMMEAGDGFVKSAIGMSEARGRAFDELVKEGITGGKDFAKRIEERSLQIFKGMFDDNGLITDDAVKYAAGEISMNLDNEVASGLSDLLNRAPILKTLVMFPRTSINVLDFVNKHSPLSYFIGDLNKVRNLAEPDEIAQYLSTKGIEYTDQTWRTFKAEVEGRVAMGTMVTMMGGWMFASGNLTGNGNYDKQLNKFQQNVAEKPLRSWRRPDGKWVSYDGIEPIATFLALTADIMENVETLGSTASENLLQKLGFAVSMNLTNKSFLQGLQPITDMMAGQDAAISRWTSNLFSVGLFNQMARVMNPGLREVDTDLQSMLRNKWNILDEVGAGKPLPQKYDFIDGSIVGREDPVSNVFNNLLPFKVSSNPSPEKEFLIQSEFDVQPALKTSLNKATYDASQRSRLAQIMGESGYFRQGLQILMNDPLIQKDLVSIKKLRERGIGSDSAELSNSITHIKLRQLLTQTVNLAKRQLAQEVPDVRLAELKALQNRNAQRRGNYSAITLTNK